MKTYPFNWPEFHAWKKEQENEVQNTTDFAIIYCVYDGFSGWKVIRIPLQSRGADVRPTGKRSILAACCLSLALLTAPAQAAEYQITEPVRIPFEVTVVNTATPATAEQMGCVLNEDETEWEC